MRQRQTGKRHVRRKPNVRPAREEGRGGSADASSNQDAVRCKHSQFSWSGVVGGAECCGSAGVCGGPLCKLIDNLRGSDKIPARVHGRAISARPCQHNLVRSGGLEKKFTPPFFFFFFFWSAVFQPFNKRTNTHADTRGTVSGAVITHSGVYQRRSRPCWARQLFHFLPVPSYYGNSKEELHDHQTDWAAKIIFISTSPSICLLQPGGLGVLTVSTLQLERAAISKEVRAPKMR